MNKSVLIVICDFVVLSMMTLIIGLSGPQQGVGGTGRSTSDIAASSVLLEALTERSIELARARQELEELSYANLEREGGRLYSCGELKEGAFNGKIEEISPGTALQENCMYILTNEEQMYGAAQILNRQLLRKIAGERNLYLLPCSLHELIVLVDDGKMNLIPDFKDGTSSKGEKRGRALFLLFEATGGNCSITRESGKTVLNGVFSYPIEAEKVIPYCFNLTEKVVYHSMKDGRQLYQMDISTLSEMGIAPEKAVDIARLKRIIREKEQRRL